MKDKYFNSNICSYKRNNNGEERLIKKRRNKPNANNTYKHSKMNKNRFRLFCRVLKGNKVQI